MAISCVTLTHQSIDDDTQTFGRMQRGQLQKPHESNRQFRTRHVDVERHRSRRRQKTGKNQRNSVSPAGKPSPRPPRTLPGPRSTWNPTWHPSTDPRFCSGYRQRFVPGTRSARGRKCWREGAPSRVRFATLRVSALRGRRRPRSSWRYLTFKQKSVRGGGHERGSVLSKCTGKCKVIQVANKLVFKYH